MSEPDEYARAVIRKALEDTEDLGTERRVDRVYRMLLAGSMLQSAYWPRGYMADLKAQAAEAAAQRIARSDVPPR